MPWKGTICMRGSISGFSGIKASSTIGVPSSSFFLSFFPPLGDTLYKNENNFPTALDSATEQHATTMTTTKSNTLNGPVRPY